MLTLGIWDFASNFPKSFLRTQTDPLDVLHSYLISQSLLSSITGLTPFSADLSSLGMVFMMNDLVWRLGRLFSPYGSMCHG